MIEVILSWGNYALPWKHILLFSNAPFFLAVITSSTCSLLLVDFLFGFFLMLLIASFAFVLPPGRSNGLEPQLGPPEDGAGAVQLQRQRRWIPMFLPRLGPDY